MVRGQWERKKPGSRQHGCWNEANFSAMGNLQAEQGQMGASSKRKSAVWFADKWKLVRARETNVHTKGDPKYGRLNF